MLLLDVADRALSLPCGMRKYGDTQAGPNRCGAAPEQAVNDSVRMTLGKIKLLTLSIE